MPRIPVRPPARNIPGNATSPCVGVPRMRAREPSYQQAMRYRLLHLHRRRGTHTSRADVDLVAARLRAHAAAHWIHRETTEDAEGGERRDANAATGHVCVLAAAHATVSSSGRDWHLVEGRRVRTAMGRGRRSRLGRMSRRRRCRGASGTESLVDIWETFRTSREPLRWPTMVPCVVES